ncbi:MAG: hypothetical protein AAF357_12195 [Verrucomicrobiota bacterium]
MGVSIYHYAQRDTPLTGSEWEIVKTEMPSAIADAEANLHPDSDDGWETPSIYELNSPTYRPHNPRTVISGSTGVRTNEEIEHWIAMISRIRSSIDGAEWEVRLEDQPFEWNSETKTFFLPPPPPRPHHDVTFEESDEWSSGEFLRLAALSLDLRPDASLDEIEDAAITRHGEEVELRFIPADSVPPESIEKLLSEKLLWAIFGKGISPRKIQVEWHTQRD